MVEDPAEPVAPQEERVLRHLREPIRIHRRGTAAAASPAACAAACRAALPPCLFYNFARAKGQCVLLASRAEFHAAGAQFLTAAA